MNSLIRFVHGAGTPDSKLAYSPQCDLRNVGLELLRMLIATLASGTFSSHAKNTMAGAGLGPSELAHATAVLAGGIAAYLESESLDLGADIDAAGFTPSQISPVLIETIYGQIGRIFMAHFGVAMGASVAGAIDEMPYQAILAKFKDEAAAMVAASVSPSQGA